MSVIVDSSGNPVFAGGGITIPGSGPTGKAAVTPADLTYLGMFSVGANWSAIRWGYEEGGMTGRRVGGQLRLLCLSGYNAPPLYNNIPSIYEIVPPADETLTTTRMTMPASTFIRDWGPVADTLPCLSSDGNRIRGIGWDAGLNACWAGYAPKYGHEHNPSISYVVFNDTTNVAARYGPWRTAAHCKMTGGYMCPITSAFSAAHCGGAPMALGCATLSRNGSSAWGPIFIPTPRLDTYASTPPDQVQAYDGEPINSPGGAHPRYSIPNPYVGMQYPYWAQRMRTDFDKVVKCAWGTTHAGNPGHDPLFPPYDTATHGGHIDLITGPWSEPMDWWASMAMIETATRQGLCYFSTIVGPTPGYPDPAHSWYGTKACSHYYEDKRHDVSTAGDGTSSKMNAMHVYDLGEMAQVVAGTMTAETIRGIQHNLYPSPLSLVDFQDAAMDDLFIGAYFDEVTGRLYLRERYGDSRGALGYWGTGDTEPRSAIHVFQVA